MKRSRCYQSCTLRPTDENVFSCVSFRRSATSWWSPSPTSPTWPAPPCPSPSRGTGWLWLRGRTAASWQVSAKPYQSDVGLTWSAICRVHWDRLWTPGGADSHSAFTLDAIDKSVAASSFFMGSLFALAALYFFCCVCCYEWKKQKQKCVERNYRWVTGEPIVNLFKSPNDVKKKKKTKETFSVIWRVKSSLTDHSLETHLEIEGTDVVTMQQLCIFFICSTGNSLVLIQTSKLVK